MRLAILDGDQARCAAMAATLRETGHACVEFHAGEQLRSAVRRERFDLLVMDIDAPDAVPAEMQAWIAVHAAGPLPVLVLVDADNAGSAASRVEDQLVKPVQAAALKTRVDQVLRRHYHRRAPSSVEVFGAHAFDSMAMTATVGGVPVELTAKEFGLALLLFRNLNKPLSRVQIMEAVWGRVPDLPSRTLDAHVSQIRSRLGLRPENGLRLASVYSFGYRLDTVEIARATA